MRCDIKPVKLLTIITERRNGKKLANLLNENGYDFHSAFLGKGTAPDELTVYLGLESEKVIFVCFLDQDKAKSLLQILDDELFSDDGGLAFTVRVNSASNLEMVKLVTGLDCQ